MTGFGKKRKILSICCGQLRKLLAERAAPKGTFENDFEAIPRSVDVVIAETLGVADAVRSSGQAASRCSSDIDNIIILAPAGLQPGDWKCRNRGDGVFCNL